MDAEWRGSSLLEHVLTVTGHYRDIKANPLDFESVAREIDAGRPVAIRINWNGGGAHFVVITGYDRARGTFTIEDPWLGRSQLTAEVLRTSYRGIGKWTLTYLTTMGTPEPANPRRRAARH